MDYLFPVPIKTRAEVVRGCFKVRSGKCCGLCIHVADSCGDEMWVQCKLMNHEASVQVTEVCPQFKRDRTQM